MLYYKEIVMNMENSRYGAHKYLRTRLEASKLRCFATAVDEF
jgi:hypothetical protein